MLVVRRCLSGCIASRCVVRRWSKTLQTNSLGTFPRPCVCFAFAFLRCGQTVGTNVIRVPNRTTKSLPKKLNSLHSESSSSSESSDLSLSENERVNWMRLIPRHKSNSGRRTDVPAFSSKIVQLAESDLELFKCGMKARPEPRSVNVASEPNLSQRRKKQK